MGRKFRYAHKNNWEKYGAPCTMYFAASYPLSAIPAVSNFHQSVSFLLWAIPLSLTTNQHHASFWPFQLSLSSTSQPCAFSGKSQLFLTSTISLIPLLDHPSSNLSPIPFSGQSLTSSMCMASQPHTSSKPCQLFITSPEQPHTSSEPSHRPLMSSENHYSTSTLPRPQLYVYTYMSTYCV